MHRLDMRKSGAKVLRRVPRENVPFELVEYWNRRLYERRDRDWT